ncbi:hypothetical protein IWX49DRAFT_209834 [Phyllosticta citricarpa]|uniref:Uncharacterized protein n=1 Tax=Phyllosticta citricarpa TaxID=55181 RepID=A0ABR1MNT6_9PEZI
MQPPTYPATYLCSYARSLARSYLGHLPHTPHKLSPTNQPTNQPTNLPPIPPDPIHPSLDLSSHCIHISLHTHRAWTVPKQSMQTHLGPRSLFRPQPITAAPSLRVHPLIGHRTRRTDGRTERVACGRRAAGNNGEGGRRKAEGGRDGWMGGWMDGWMDGRLSQLDFFFFSFLFLGESVSRSVRPASTYACVLYVGEWRKTRENEMAMGDEPEGMYRVIKGTGRGGQPVHRRWLTS